MLRRVYVVETNTSVATFLDAICIGNKLSVVNWLLVLWSLISRLWPAAVVQQGISDHHLVVIVIWPGNLYPCHSADLPVRS